MKKTIIMGSVNVNKVKEQIRTMQNISGKSDADNVSEKDIGNCKIDLLAGLKRKPTKNNNFCLDHTCELKKKDTKSKIKESLAELSSKENR